jgi:hypothetical protein
MPCGPHFPGLSLLASPSRLANSVRPKRPTWPPELLPPRDDATPYHWLQPPPPLASVAAAPMPLADSSTPKEAKSTTPPALLFSKWCPAPSSPLPTFNAEMAEAIGAPHHRQPFLRLPRLLPSTLAPTKASPKTPEHPVSHPPLIRAPPPLPVLLYRHQAPLPSPPQCEPALGLLVPR